MAPLSKMEIGLPSGPSGSMIAGMRLFGLIFKKAGLNWSPAPMFTGVILYGSPISSQAMVIFNPFGVGQKNISIGSAILVSSIARTISAHSAAPKTLRAAFRSQVL